LTSKQWVIINNQSYQPSVLLKHLCRRHCNLSSRGDSHHDQSTAG